MENNVKTGNAYTNAFFTIVKVATAGMLLGFGAAVANRSYRTSKECLDICDEYLEKKCLKIYFKLEKLKRKIKGNS